MYIFLYSFPKPNCTYLYLGRGLKFFIFPRQIDSNKTLNNIIRSPVLEMIATKENLPIFLTVIKVTNFFISNFVFTLQTFFYQL